MSMFIGLLTDVRRFVAKCKLCGWQWAITEDQRDLALKGCPVCGSGENMITLEEENSHE